MNRSLRKKLRSDAGGRRLLPSRCCHGCRRTGKRHPLMISVRLVERKNQSSSSSRSRRTGCRARSYPHKYIPVVRMSLTSCSSYGPRECRGDLPFGRRSGLAGCALLFRNRPRTANVSGAETSGWGVCENGYVDLIALVQPLTERSVHPGASFSSRPLFSINVTR